MSSEVPGSSWMTSLAVLALAAAGVNAPAEKGCHWLLTQEGRRPGLQDRMKAWLTRSRPAIDSDLQLVGWPWSERTTAWVEPTSWALLALKHVAPSSRQAAANRRIHAAERLLVDRMCVGGGWNYGNRKVLDEALPPFPDTTAIALIALQGSPSRDVTEPSLDRLEEMLATTPSSLGLALGVLAYRLHGWDPAPFREALMGRVDRVVAAADVRTSTFVLMALDDGPPPLEVSRA